MESVKKRFPTNAILSLGSRYYYDFPTPGFDIAEQIEEIALYMMSGRYADVDSGIRRSVLSYAIRAQFPKIDFYRIDDLFLPFVNGFDCDTARPKYCYDPSSKKYKKFLLHLADSCGSNRFIAKCGEDFPWFYFDGTTPDGYLCACCGASGTKMWRPYMDVSPLVCATCAESRQTSRSYSAIGEWRRTGYDSWSAEHLYDGEGNPICIPMDNWVVNDAGKIPSEDAPRPDGKWSMTDQISVDLHDIDPSYGSGSSSMVPAVPSGGGYWGYTSVPQAGCEWWDHLPTHK